VSYRSAIKTLLLVFVAASVFYLVVQQTRQKDSPPAPSAVMGAAAAAESARPSETGGGRKILAYYFYTTVRCPTCRMIEAFSEEALKQAFANELRNGRLEWHPVNVQLPENRHFIKDYQLFTKSLVIARVQDGRQVEWKNLERVWELTGDRRAFLQYVQDEVGAYLRR
jgi:hypothetical protein